MSANNIISKFEKTEHELQIREKELDKKQNQIVSLEDKIKIHTLTRNLLTELSKTLHTRSTEEISKFVTKGLQTIFGKPYKFIMDMKTERNKASVEFKIIDPDNVELDPRSDVGGGIMDTIAMLLRFIIWLLSPNKTRPTFLLDEPLKFLSSDYLNRASNFLQEIATTFGLQIYMNTHEPELMNIGKRLAFTWESGKTIITEVIPEVE